MTRQQKRATERRDKKMPAGVVERTSHRHISKTKGTPFSRMKLLSVTPAQSGVPAVFNLKGYTTGKSQAVKATAENIGWFFPSLPLNMKQALLGFT